MGKISKGDKIIARSPAVIDENTYSKIGGHVEYPKPLTVIAVLKNGVRTKERGFIHRNNILGITDNPPPPKQ